MTKEQIKRMDELEEEYSEFLSDAKTMKERMEKCYDVVLTLINYKNSNHEYWTFFAYQPPSCERSLYRPPKH